MLIESLSETSLQSAKEFSQRRRQEETEEETGGNGADVGTRADVGRTSGTSPQPAKKILCECRGSLEQTRKSLLVQANDGGQESMTEIGDPPPART